MYLAEIEFQPSCEIKQSIQLCRKLPAAVHTATREHVLNSYNKHIDSMQLFITLNTRTTTNNVSVTYYYVLEPVAILLLGVLTW